MGSAHVAAVQDEPVMCVLSELGRRVRGQRLLDCARGFPRSEAGAVGDPEDMRVDRDLHLAKHHVENDVGGLAPDAGQCFECGAVGGYLTPMSLEDLLREA